MTKKDYIALAQAIKENTTLNGRHSSIVWTSDNRIIEYDKFVDLTGKNFRRVDKMKEKFMEACT